MCRVCEALGQRVEADGSVVRVGEAKSAGEVLAAFLEDGCVIVEKPPGVPTHASDCDCRLCWNVRLKRDGQGVLRRENPKKKRRKGRRRA